MDDEEMGIYTSGGSPLPSINSRKRMAGSDESENRSSRYFVFFLLQIG
jgi:hypothetical protein